ncbi:MULTISPECIES: hypothetical protein [Stenotrophomonas]|nr:MULTISPECIES: hypothetical protein [Stenotrophomonas]MBA0430270.1 hypothetical protein [Stenotrophomonas maltophilia]MBH1697927.1 hypothetical protein [Stenotrophomonas maltophilia]MBH1710915.1 hypothetical protein [Stenotrophomonas maltophilia]MBH1761560.1 hypothetical protein [Stenotrophomonas maltophilia]MBH1765930.1 hypothetical protein [Stenotrophomonas maltophilia]
MTRQAIVTSHTLGTIYAQSSVIEDVSPLLDEQPINIVGMFYSQMISAGVRTFRLPVKTSEAYRDLLPRHVAPIDLSDQVEVFNALKTAAFASNDPTRHSKQELRDVSALVVCLSEIYVAAKYRMPVATSFSIPTLGPIEHLLREDFLIVAKSLLGEFEVVASNLAVVKASAPASSADAFVQIIDSGLFTQYERAQAALEGSSHDRGSVLTGIGESAARLVDRFPSVLSAQQAGITLVNAVPPIAENAFGKVFGALAKPFAEVLAEMLGAQRRVVLYSFEPAWNHVWQSKLKKIAERLRPS